MSKAVLINIVKADPFSELSLLIVLSLFMERKKNDYVSEETHVLENAKRTGIESLSSRFVKLGPCLTYGGKRLPAIS